MGIGLVSLFFWSFLASTLVPGGVEGLLIYLVIEDKHSFWSLLTVATIGNTLGGWFTWWMGFLLQKGLARRRPNNRVASWFTLHPRALERVTRYGPAVLLLSWMPIIGDPLCVAAGYLKLPFWRCAIAIFLSKALRYLVLLWLIS